MLALEQLIALHGLFAGDLPNPLATVPTEASILHIQSTIGIILPQTFIEFARRCPSYCSVLFASIGEDYNDECHILNINRDFHSNKPPCVPPWMVVFNHGRDGDCEGFDARQRCGDEYSIVYWEASQGLAFDNSSWRVDKCFHDYLEFTVVYHAKARDRARAEEIIRAV